MNKDREVLVHRKLRNSSTDLLLRILEPYKHNLVIGAESTFAWYWLADFCADNHIEFVLGHALYMKAIHGGKAKNDRIDSKKIALLLQGGMFPLAYVYPRGKRALRDLLRSVSILSVCGPNSVRIFRSLTIRITVSLLRVWPIVHLLVRMWHSSLR